MRTKLDGGCSSTTPIIFQYYYAKEIIMPGTFPDPRRDQNWMKTTAAAAAAADISIQSALPDCTEEHSHITYAFQ